MGIRAGMAGMLVGAVATAAWGGVSVTIQYANTNGVVYNNTTTDSQGIDIPTFSQDVGTGTASASAHLTTGSIQVTGEASGNAGVTVVAAFSDTVRITSPSAANGTQGRIAYFVNVAGVVDADSGNAKATFSVDALPPRTNAQTNITQGGIGTEDSDNPGTFGDFLYPAPTDSLGWQSAFTFGSDFVLNVQLTCTAFARTTSTPGHASFNLAPAVFWDGIIGVYDQNDHLLSTYTMESLSGTDWKQSLPPPAAVPEAGSLGLLGAGLAGLFRRRR